MKHEKSVPLISTIIILFISNALSAQFFALQQQLPIPLIADTSAMIVRPAIADVDGDGNLDIFIGNDLGKFELYEGMVDVLGNRQFERSNEVHPFDINPESHAIFPTFVDLDNDGDMDLMAGDTAGNFLYYQNHGTAVNPSFQAVQFNPFNLRNLEGKMLFPSFADMDADGDEDLVAGDAEGVIYYFENSGTNALPAFTVPVSNPFNMDTVNTYAAPVIGDFDSDEDFDMILGGRNGKLLYFENRGDSRFADFHPQPLNPIMGMDTKTPFLPTAVDLDRDGDKDLVVISIHNLVLYYENVTAGSLGVDEVNPAFAVEIAPNPVQSFMDITTDEIIKRIEIRRMNGEPVYQEDQPDNQILLSQLEPDSYIIEITNARNEKVLKRFEKAR